MKEKQTRRDFLKTTSMSAAGASMLSVAPLSKALGRPRPTSRVVIVTDPECVDSSDDIVQERVQDMVDNAIMLLTGETDKVAAYESLFPNLTDSTNILIKYNNSRVISGIPHSVRKAVMEGLGTMLNGTYNVDDNVQEIGRATGSGTSKTFDVGSTTYAIRDIWDNCDYFINLPSCWAMGGSSYPGVTMGLKGMMPAVSGQLSRMHGNFTDSDDPPLSIMNYELKEQLGDKQVLTLLDAVPVSPSGSNNSSSIEYACKVVASRDMVACEYWGVQILDEYSAFQADWKTKALEVLALAAKDPYLLGNNLPDDMDVINYDPTKIIQDNNLVSDSQLDVKTSSTGSKIVFTLPQLDNKKVNVLIRNIHGRKVWSYTGTGNSIAWNKRDSAGKKVSSGMYLYQVKIGSRSAQGKIAVK